MKSRPLIALLLVVIFSTVTGCGGGSDPDSSDPGLQGHVGRAVLEGPMLGSRVEFCRLTDFVEIGTCLPVYETSTLGLAQSDPPGSFAIPDEVIDLGEPYYLLRITGGVEGASGDARAAVSRAGEFAGAYHAVLTPAQIRRGDFKVTVLTEILFQRVKARIDVPPIGGDVNDLIPSVVDYGSANALTGDVNGIGAVNGDDVAVWDPDLHRDLLTYAWPSYQVVMDRIRSGAAPGYLAVALSGSSDVTHVEVAGDTAYLSNDYYLRDLTGSDRALQVIDLSATDASDRLAMVHAIASDAVYVDENPCSMSSRRPQDILISAGILYLAERDSSQGGCASPVVTWSKGVESYDLSSFAGGNEAPLSRWTSAVWTTPSGLEHINGYLLMTDGDVLYSVDASDPTNLTGDQAGTRYTDMAGIPGDPPLGGHLLAADGQTLLTSGLLAIDMHNPEIPTKVGVLPTSGSPSAVAMETSGGLLYLVDEAAVLRVYDVTNPAAMRLVGSFDLKEVWFPFAPTSIAVADGLVFIGCGADGIHQVDVSDPASLRYLGRLDTRGEVRNMVLALPTLYVADGSAGLGIYREDDTVLEPKPVPFVDQQQTGIDYPLELESNYLSYRWQHFVPSTEKLIQVEINIEKVGAPGDLVVEITPEYRSNVISRTVLPEAEVHSGWVTLDFAPALALTPGETYSIYVYPAQASPGPGDRYLWRGSQSSSYDSGARNDVIDQFPDFDYAFRTWTAP